MTLFEDENSLALRVPRLGRWVTSCLFAMTTGSRRRVTPLGDLGGGKQHRFANETRNFQ